jgi:hypothetical protein
LHWNVSARKLGGFGVPLIAGLSLFLLRFEPNLRDGKP